MNKKLKLDLDSLEVQSFASAGARVGRGTVQGHDQTVFDCMTPNTVIAHYCNPNSSPMDCMDTAVRSCYGECVVGM